VMSELSIYIIEDEEIYAGQLSILVEELNYKLAGIKENSDEAKAEILNLKPDLLLVDIKINGSMNGIDLVKSIHKKVKTPVIFITSFADEATFERAKEVNPYAYLTKPFDAATLQRMIELAFNKLLLEVDQPNESWPGDLAFQEAFFIKNRHRLEKVSYQDILYLDVEDRYSTIYTESGRKFVLRMSMVNVQNKLPKLNFFRVHRKFSVNLNKVTTIDLQDNLLHLGEITIPISRLHKEELMEKLKWLQ